MRHRMKALRGFMVSSALVSLALITIALWAGYAYFKSVARIEPRKTACPLDAKLCPDGSAVGRTGPNCEFSECPASEVMGKEGGEVQNQGMLNDMLPKNGLEEGETMVKIRGTLLAGKADHPLLEFSSAGYEDALRSGNLIVLYFYANWCSICRKEFPDMQAAFNELDINARVIGFRVNYKDSETSEAEEELAREFGVAYQHTKVLVKNGARVLKDGTSWDKGRYTTEIHTYMQSP